MAKNIKFHNQFNISQIKSHLSDLDPLVVYSFTQKNQPNEFYKVTGLLPPGYFNDLKDKIQSVDFIYSGSNEHPYILGIFVGRLDQYQGKETYDIDFFNIAPESGSIDNYFLKQFPHIKDSYDQRVSIELNPSLYSSSIDRKIQLYNTYLTGSITRLTFEQYEKDKPEYIKIFKDSFK